MKPYQGRIESWYIVRIGRPNDEHLGYYIRGISRGGRPQWEGKSFYTSMVVKREMLCIETLNSRYELGKPANTKTSYTRVPMSLVP